MIYDYRDAKQLKVDLISGCEKQNPLGSGGGLRWAQSALLNILFLAGGIFFFFWYWKRVTCPLLVRGSKR